MRTIDWDSGNEDELILGSCFDREIIDYNKIRKGLESHVFRKTD